MSTEVHVHIDGNGKTLDQVMRETRLSLDALIAEELKAIEWAAHCDGCPPHELEKFMRNNRDRCMAARDRFLEQWREQLGAWP
jgi:hypothetical protein